MKNSSVQLLLLVFFFQVKLVKVIKSVLPNAMSSRELRSDSFFTFLRNFFKDVSLQKLQTQGLFSVNDFLNNLTKFVIEREPIEQQNKDF